MRRSRLILLLLCATSCRSAAPPPTPLSPPELALVQVYMRISWIESLRTSAPDSVGPALDRVRQSYDSLAVRAALAGLETAPERWALVYEEIARRLQAIEESSDPRRTAIEQGILPSPVSE